MPFQYLSERLDGQILSAGYLNALSENIDYVYAAATMRNMPFQGYANLVIGTVNVNTVRWYFRWRTGFNYLHYLISAQGSLDYLRIKVQTSGSSVVTLFADGTPPGGPQTFSGVVDSSMLLDGHWYGLWVEADFLDEDNTIRIDRLIFSDSNSFGTQSSANYTAPPIWARGDTVSASDINKYKTALDAAHALLGNERILMPVRRNNTQDRGFQMIHRWRWLHYVGSGELVDVQNGNNNIALSGSSTARRVYDLWTADWMYPGLRYVVKDVDFAVEDYES